MRRTGRAVSALCFGLAAMAWTPRAIAQAPALQTPADGKRVWTENFDYRVEIAGVWSQRARMFNANGRPSMLLIAPELKGPLVLQLAGHEVLSVDPGAVEEGAIPEQVMLADEGIHGPPSPYTLDGDTVVLFQEGRKVRLGRKPPILGATTPEALLAQLPAYRKGMAGYAPAEQDTIYLKTYKHAVSIEVFFGSWCPHCRETVPRFLKSLDVASNGNLKVSMVGVPTPFTEYPPAKEKSIRGVPTFIISAEGKEIGRIINIPEDSSIEHELVKILFAYAQGKG